MARPVFRRAWSISLLLWLALHTDNLTPQAPAVDPTPVKLPGESVVTVRRLAEAHKRVEQRQWSDAVEEYQRILEEAGDDLVTPDPQKPQLCVQARRVCHIAIASLPPEALKLYRRRADEPAKKWLDQGSAERDPLVLRRLVDQAFCSRHTDRAIDLLGDLALERGAFEEAEQWWRMLARPASEKPAAGATLALVFPDPQTDVAQVRAKQILARLLRGERGPALAELKAFHAAHAKAEGQLAGRQGNYAALLEKASAAVASAGPIEEQAWPTFAGAPARTCVLDQAPRCRWLEPTWRVRLDGSDPAKADGDGPVLTPSQAARACAFFPVIVGNLVLVADARAVTAYDRDSGRQVGRCDVVDDLKNGGLDLDTGLPVKNDVRYTLTVSGARVYARLGAGTLPRPRNGKGEAAKPGRADSFLICLALPPTEDGKLTPLWQARPRLLDRETAALFEGAPVVRGDQVFIARTRFTADGRATTSIDCYAADSGAIRWEREVCEAREAGDAAPRYRHHLLTLAGGNLVYCSHSGVVVALDAASGKRLWATRYPRRGIKTADGQPSPRDLAPCVFADGRVFAAPADADRIFCFDAATGRALWESTPREVVQLLGVARGRLIFTTGSKQRGIRALDAMTGNDLRDWIQPPEGDRPTLGRGLLAGDLVFWPTIHGMVILSQEDGTVPLEAYLPKNSVTGNLAAGSGCLVAATDRELLGYVPESRSLEQRRKGAAAQPGDREAQFRFATALAAAGRLEQAVEQFRRTEELGGNNDWLQGVRGELHAGLLAVAEQHGRNKDWDKATVALQEATAAPFQVPLRLQALDRLALLRERLGQPEVAVALWQALLADAELRRGRLIGADQLPQPAAAVAAQHIERLIRAHGPAVYTRYETDARELLATLRKDKDKVHALAVRLTEEFPNSAAARELLRTNGELPGQVTRAAASRWFLGFSANESDRALALAALARHYEQTLAWEAAAASWKRLTLEYGELTVDAIDRTQVLSAVVSRELRKPEYRNPAAPTQPELGLPLTRSWSTLGSERLLPMSGQGMLLKTAPVFFQRDDRILVCRDALTGDEKRAASLNGAVTWLGQQADLIVAAGPRHIQGLQMLTGTELGRLWEFTVPAEATADGLDCFQLSGSRLFFMQGGRRLGALDVETGRMLWQCSAPGAHLPASPPAGRFDPHYRAGPDVVVVRTSDERWVLEAQTGRILYQSGDHDVPWPQPPMPLDSLRFGLVPDPHHVLLFEPLSGREIWKHTIERSTSLSGKPPQLLGSGATLFMLVQRNQGQELVRLDPASGSARWTRFLGNGRSPFEMSAAAFDGSAFYVAGDNVLRAFALDSGEPLWQTPLGSRPARWRVAVTKRGLLVYPTEAQAELEGAVLYRRYLAANVNALLPVNGCVPIGAALPGVLAVIQQEQQASRISLLLLDPADGRLIQRLNLASVGSRVDVAFIERSLVIAGGGAAWGAR